MSVSRVYADILAMTAEEPRVGGAAEPYRIWCARRPRNSYRHPARPAERGERSFPLKLCSGRIHRPRLPGAAISEAAGEVAGRADQDNPASG